MSKPKIPTKWTTRLWKILIIGAILIAGSTALYYWWQLGFAIPALGEAVSKTLENIWLIAASICIAILGIVLRFIILPREQRITIAKAILIIILASAIFGAPYVSWILTETVHMSELRAFLLGLGSAVAGIALLLLWYRRQAGRKKKERS